jgi:hypothetical protein
MDAAQFRTDFPEFADVVAYPDSSVDFWIRLATKLLRPSRWADVLDEGIELFVAHNLALQRAASSGGSSGVPGMNSGVVASKTVDKLSITYDSSVGIVPNAGHWNLTTYGTRFLWLMNMAGMGPTQLGAGVAHALDGEVWVVGGILGNGWPYGS